MDKIQLAQNLINSLLNETRKSAIAPRQLASIYQHILDIVSVDDEARNQAVKDAQTAASGAQQTLQQMQTITLQAAEDFGTIPVQSARNNKSVVDDEAKDKIKQVLEALKKNKSVVGSLFVDSLQTLKIMNASLGSKYNDTDRVSDDTITFEAAKTDCTNSNIRFLFVRVFLTISKKTGNMIYDSSQLRKIDIPITEDWKVDVKNLVYMKDLNPLLTMKGMHGSYLSFDFNFNSNTLTDDDYQFFVNPFDIAEFTVLRDELEQAAMEFVTYNVVMDISENETVMFPCVFRRKQIDDEFDITGEGIFTRNDKSIWRIYINTTLSNGEVEVEFRKLSENNIFNIVNVESSGTLHQLKLDKPASLLKPSSVVQGQFTEGVYMSVSVMNTTRFDGDENIYMLGMMDLSGDLFYVRGYIADDMLYVDFQDVPKKLEFSPSDFAVAGSRIAIQNDTKRRVFIDLWKTKCGSHGGYNEKMQLFELNGLTDITYDEALKIYQFDTTSLALRLSTNQSTNWNNRWQLCDISLRTVIPAKSRMVGCALAGSYKAKIDIWKFGEYEYISNAEDIGGVNHFPDVQKILNVIAPSSNEAARSIFKSNNRLTDMKLLINATITEVDLSDNPLLTLESYRWMVDNTKNASAVTVSVPADIYSKMTGGSEDWVALASDAAAKKISFATAG